MPELAHAFMDLKVTGFLVVVRGSISWVSWPVRWLGCGGWQQGKVGVPES